MPSLCGTGNHDAWLMRYYITMPGLYHARDWTQSFTHASKHSTAWVTPPAVFDENPKFNFSCKRRLRWHHRKSRHGQLTSCSPCRSLNVPRESPVKEMQAIKIRRAYESSAFIYCLPESPFPSLRSWVITAGQHRCLPAWEQVPQVWRGWTGLSQRGLADGPYTPQWVDKVCCYRNQSPLRAHE